MKNLTKKPTENCGYHILDYKKSKTFSDLWIALAYSPAKDDFVTWNYTERAEFYWGHYFGDYESAFTDFLERSK